MHFPFGLGTHIEARDTDISEHELVSRLLQLHDRSHGQDAEFVCERYDYIRRKTSRAGFYAKLLHNSELQTALQTVTEAEVAVAEQYYNDVRAAKRAGGALPAKSVFVTPVMSWRRHAGVWYYSHVTVVTTGPPSRQVFSYCLTASTRRGSLARTAASRGHCTSGTSCSQCNGSKATFICE